MIFPHRYTRSIFVISLLLIAGIWMWVGSFVEIIGDPPAPSEVLYVGSLRIAIPTLVQGVEWFYGSPVRHPVGEYLVGEGMIKGYAAYSSEQPFPGTNLFDAFLQVATATSTEEMCRSAERDGEERVASMETSGTVAGLPAYIASFNGAAAGTFMESSVTHVYHDRKCYEMSINVFSGNIGNYPNGSVVEFPREEVLNTFQQIIDRAIIK